MMTESKKRKGGISMDKNKSRAKSHKTGFSLLTIIAVAFTVIGYFNTAAEFWERLDSMGIRDALTGSSLVLILAAVAVIFSFIYLISSWRAKRNAKKALIALAEQAEEAKARGEEFVMPERTTGAKFGSAMSTVLDAITKTIIIQSNRFILSFPPSFIISLATVVHPLRLLLHCTECPDKNK